MVICGQLGRLCRHKTDRKGFPIQFSFLNGSAREEQNFVVLPWNSWCVWDSDDAITDCLMNGYTALSSSPSQPSDASICYLWGDWSSLAERSGAERLPCLLSLIIHTPGGGPWHAHTHTHTLSFSPLVHTHLDLRSDLAYIIHAGETDQTLMHTCWSCFAFHMQLSLAALKQTRTEDTSL